MHKILALCLLICLTIGTSACGGSRVVLVPPGQLVRLGPDVRGHVYVMTDTGWQLSRNRVSLPEGWYAGPGPDDSSNESATSPR